MPATWRWPTSTGSAGTTLFDKSAELGRQLLAARGPDADPVTMVMFLASGIDIADDQCIAGLESVLGPEVTIFGATSSDNMKGIVSYQMVDDAVYEHGARAVGSRTRP